SAGRNSSVLARRTLPELPGLRRGEGGHAPGCLWSELRQAGRHQGEVRSAECVPGESERNAGGVTQSGLTPLYQGASDGTLTRGMRGRRAKWIGYGAQVAIVTAIVPAGGCVMLPVSPSDSM